MPRAPHLGKPDGHPMTWLFVDDDHDDEDDAYMTEERKMVGIRSSDPAPDPISSDVSLYSVLPIAALHILNRIEIGKGEGRLRAEAKAMGEVRRGFSSSAVSALSCFSVFMVLFAQLICCDNGRRRRRRGMWRRREEGRRRRRRKPWR